MPGRSNIIHFLLNRITSLQKVPPFFTFLPHVSLELLGTLPSRFMLALLHLIGTPAHGFHLELNYPRQNKANNHRVATQKSMTSDSSNFQVQISMEKGKEIVEKYLCFQTILSRLYFLKYKINN